MHKFLVMHAKFIFEPQYTSISVSGNLQCHILKMYHLQYSHMLNLALIHIWLANPQRHKIRYLHTSQPAFIGSSNYASHSVCLHVDEEHTLLLCHLITAFTTAYRHSKHLPCFEITVRIDSFPHCGLLGLLGQLTRIIKNVLQLQNVHEQLT